MLVASPVRKAVLADKPEVLDVCVENHRDNGQFALSMPKVEAMVDKAFNRGGTIIGVVGSGRIEGLILLNIGQMWYSDDWMLEEIQNCVRAPYRKSTHAKDLMAFARRCSDELSIPLAIGVVSNERTRAKMELYRRQFGEPCGGYFLYHPKTVALTA